MLAPFLFLFMGLQLQSPCKVNLILNILGKRQDGFHELETVMHPVPICDTLTLEKGGEGVELTCSSPELPCDASNLVYRAAEAFYGEAGLSASIRVHLEKRIPLAAGLGGGSGNAATTLLGLNQLHDSPLSLERMDGIARTLGSDVPFFLHGTPALGTGRGEVITPLAPFAALADAWVFLVRPGFGVSTPWAYQNLARFPQALAGRPGRALELIEALQTGGLSSAVAHFYNALEAPVLEKYPLLAVYQEFLLACGAVATLMSGSGSTTFAIMPSKASARGLLQAFGEQFGTREWTAIAPLGPVL
jgi:4-diphosphocytidyl-2-C-methyl-D-erythritol kinase